MSRRQRKHFDPLEAISPVDGRYFGKTRELKLFGEGGLIKCRTQVEAKWLRQVCRLLERPITPSEEKLLKKIERAGITFQRRVKELERTSNHDVKAVELAIAELLEGTSLTDLIPWVHIGETSEDTSNLAYGMQLQAGVRFTLQLLSDVYGSIASFARENAALPMLARTHGQAATPTTLGKEFVIFDKRIGDHMRDLKAATLLVKFSGASGNWNAHEFIADIDWPAFSKTFVTTQFPSDVLPFAHNHITTQVESHETYAKLFGILRHLCTTLISFCQDVWSYISEDWIKLKVIAAEIGSSTMPHKVNPIDFENAEGNLYMARGLFANFEDVLPIMRRQRHLSDCTIIRNFGVAFAHLAIALRSIQRGMGKIEASVEAIGDALADRWELLGEAIQTAMRRHGIKDAYDQLKKFTRGKIITKPMLHDFIRATTLPAKVQEKLLALTPSTYLGYAVVLAQTSDGSA